MYRQLYPRDILLPFSTVVVVMSHQRQTTSAGNRTGASARSAEVVAGGGQLCCFNKTMERYLKRKWMDLVENERRDAFW